MNQTVCTVLLLISVFGLAGCKSSPPREEPKTGFISEDVFVARADGDTERFPEKLRSNEKFAIVEAARQAQKIFIDSCLQSNPQDQQLCLAASVVCGESRFSNEYSEFRKKVKVQPGQQSCNPVPESGAVRCQVTREFRLPGLKRECINLRKVFSPCCDRLLY